MIGEQKAKALVAGGVALFVTGLVVLMLFVIPAARHTQVAMAQDSAPSAPPVALQPDAMMPGGMPPGATMAGTAAPAGAAAAGAERMTSEEPLEPGRPNPFLARVTPGVGVAAAVVAATTYGPDWSKLPIAERVAFVLPEIPPAPTPAAPVVARAPEVGLRITSILWDASGQAQAAYEDGKGGTGILKPGDRIDGYAVTTITRSSVRVENRQTGSSEELELQPRAERPQGARTTGGAGSTGRGTSTTGAQGGRARP